MARYVVGWKESTKTIKILPYGTPVGTGFTDIGDFYHNDVLDILEKKAEAYNHVFFHHIRDLLYKKNVLSLQGVQITIPVVSISVDPATKSLLVGGTQRLKVTFTPANAVDQRLTFTSSDDEKAVVDATGLITAVAAGEATITATTEDGGKTDTCVVTVSIPEE